MGVGNEWEQRYAESTHLSVWPWSDIVSLVYRYCKPSLVDKKDARVLEFGCGAGANIPLFTSFGADYYSVEGSSTIVATLHNRYPKLANNIQVGDFTVDQPFGENFDLVVDRASLTHNNTASIISGLNIAYNSLKPGGVFIGSDFFSTGHSDYLVGEHMGDKYMRTNYTKGQFAKVGCVHFFDETLLRTLFSKFKILLIEEKVSRRYEPNEDYQFASWNIVAQKIA